MRIFSRVSSLWRNLLQRPRVDAALDDELQSFLEMLVDRNIKTA
jgi:hypothetical protein